MLRTVGGYFDGDVAAAGRIDGQLFDLQRDDVRLAPTTFSGAPKSRRHSPPDRWTVC